MTETIPPHPFDEMDALAWLRSQPDGRVTASAAELGRQWGWNRMRTGRRLKAWQEAGLIRRNAEAIIVTTSVTSTVTDVTPTVTEAVSATIMSEATGAKRSMTPVKAAAFVVALTLACISAAFSIDGLTAIFAGAFWPIITMGAALEAGKLVAAAWLTEHWNSAPRLLRPNPVGQLLQIIKISAPNFSRRRSNIPLIPSLQRPGADRKDLSSPLLTYQASPLDD